MLSFTYETFKSVAENADLTQKLIVGFLAVTGFIGTVYIFIPRAIKKFRSVFEEDRNSAKLNLEMDEESLIRITPNDDEKYEFQFILVVGDKTRNRIYTKDSFNSSTHFPINKNHPFLLALSKDSSSKASIPIIDDEEYSDPIDDYYSILICYNVLLEYNYSLCGWNFYSDDVVQKDMGSKVTAYGQEINSPIELNDYNNIDSIFVKNIIKKMPNNSVDRALDLIIKKYNPRLIKSHK